MIPTPPLRQIRIVILLTTAIFLSTASGCGNDPDVYQELFGTWVTHEEQYKDRYIIINNELITFGTGGEAPNLFFIETARKKENSGIRQYEFDCVNTEEAYFSFVFNVEELKDQTILRLKNPHQVIWEKISEAEKGSFALP